MADPRTEIGQIGEFGLIGRISQGASPLKKSTYRGIGDDAAVIDQGENYFLISTEIMVEGIHFDLTFHPLKHLGYKIVTAGVSDIIAMNGTPEHITIALALSNRFSVQAVDEIYEGIRHACEVYNVDLVGGDTAPAREGLALSVTAAGHVAKPDLTLRSTAKVNNIICLSGDLGAAFTGLQLLEREKKVFLSDASMQPDLEGNKYAVGRQLMPTARLDVVEMLRKLGIVPTAMIDVSDGLASELHHVCGQSGCGALIFEDKIPISEETIRVAEELRLPVLTAALNGGEDYELLFTIDQADYEKLRDAPLISFLGYITADPGIFLKTVTDTLVPLEAQGWPKPDS